MAERLSFVFPFGELWVYACECGHRLSHRRRRFVAMLGAEHDCLQAVEIGRSGGSDDR